MINAQKTTNIVHSIKTMHNGCAKNFIKLEE